MSRFSGFRRAADTFKELAQSFVEAANGTDEAVGKGLEDTAQDIALTASRLAPRKSGRLASSIDYQQLDEHYFAIGSPLDRAEWIENGRGPVVAKDAEALRFEIDGRVLFRERVGPAEPQPFLRPALLRHQDDIEGNIEEQFELLFGSAF